mgnify:CR=1 FL=1
MNEMEMTIMQLIIHSGDAKTHGYDSEGADEEIKLAHDALIVAHNAQTSLLQKEAAGEKVEISALFVHAQDHLMTSMSELNLIEQIVELRKVVNTLLENQK